MIQEQTLT